MTEKKDKSVTIMMGQQIMVFHKPGNPDIKFVHMVKDLSTFFRVTQATGS